MTSFPSFASVNLFWFAVGSRLAACRAEAARRRVSRRWGVRYHSEGTAAQRRGYNTCHATGLRLLRNRGEADALRSITACSGPLCRRLARLKLRTGVSGSFRIKQSGAITTSIPSTRSNTRVRLPGNAQIGQPALAEGT